MNRERYQKVKALFLEGREIPPAERASWLEAACESDTSLRAEVDSLLAEDVAPARLDGRRPSDDTPERLDAGATSTGSRVVPRATGMMGSYRLLDVIGAGGMGIVYRAEQKKPRRAVALKVIKSGLASPETLERFEREAEVLGRLHHPGIAQIYEAATADTGSGPQPFFVMELIDGEPLTEYVETRAMTMSARLELFLKVCDAVEHAHRAGVVHRDLKPANILVDEYGAPKILDFGVARTTDMESTHRMRTEAGQIIGTIPYMSPEQVSAEPGDIDALADVYSLGIICYELLSGRLPFDLDGRALPEAVRIISEANPTPLGSVDRVFRGEIETIIARALEKDKVHRYASVSGFADEVRRYLRGESSPAGPSRAVARPDGSPVTNIPFSRNPFFTGREEVLERLRAVMTEDRDPTRSRLMAIGGLGGIGKTQTAVEYAYRHVSDYPIILWARAESRDEVVSSLGEIARVLELPSKDEKDTSVIVAAVRNWLEKHTDWLLVLDNVEDPEILEEFLPASAGGHVVLTSRAQVFRSLGVSKPLVLGQMKPEEAREFLFRSTDADADDELEVKAADELALELGHLPLALEQAAALISENHARIQDYLTAYRAQRTHLMGEGRPKDYDHSVSTTWDMSFARVEEISGAAADVLRLSAFLSPEAIPLELISSGAAECGPRLAGALEGAAGNPLLVHKTLEPLTRFSLIHVDPASRSFTVHRLVQRVLEDRMDQAARSLWADRAVRAVNATFPGFYPDNEQLEHWALCGQLLPHATAVTDLLEELELDLDQAGDVLDKMAAYLILGGRYAAAEQINRRSLGLRLRSFGAGHRKVGRCLHGLALTAHQQLQYGPAEALYKRAIEIWEMACGPEHHQVAVGLQNLGLLYRQQGDYGTARGLYKRVLDVREKEFGTEHRQVASTLNSLALVHLECGEDREAERLLRRSLALRRRASGSDHSSLAPVLHNLGAFLLDTGNYTDAESLIERALAIRKKTFGRVHHEVAINLAIMAKLYHRQKRYTAAESLYRRAIDMLEKTIGSEHYHCARVFELFCELLLELNQSHEAEDLAARALRIRQKQERPLEASTIVL